MCRSCIIHMQFIAIVLSSVFLISSYMYDSLPFVASTLWVVSRLLASSSSASPISLLRLCSSKNTLNCPSTYSVIVPSTNISHALNGNRSFTHPPSSHKLFRCPFVYFVSHQHKTGWYISISQLCSWHLVIWIGTMNNLRWHIHINLKLVNLLLKCIINYLDGQFES